MSIDIKAWSKPEVKNTNIHKPSKSQIKSVQTIVRFLNNKFNICPVQKEKQIPFKGYFCVNNNNEATFYIGCDSFYTLENKSFQTLKKIILKRNKFISDIISSCSTECIIYKKFKIV